jgi:hypothetical protein
MMCYAACVLAVAEPLTVFASPAAAQAAPELVDEWHGTVAGTTGD